ncbi:MAG: methyltransferase domain-containing protein [Planctomycetes bacterium]|nr:methyltransferase domain-containing protein [Planctomycetota bacterium]
MTTAPPKSKRLERYNSGVGARSYVSEYDEKVHRKLSDRRERKLFDRLASRLEPGGLVVDLPSGFGRLSDVFQRFGERLVGSDWSFDMLRLRNERLAAQGGDPRSVRVRVPHMPFRDRSVHCICSIRLNHHLKAEEERVAHLRELTRVSKRYVLFTYFDAGTLKNRLRALRVRLFGLAPKRTLPYPTVRRILDEEGFRILAAPLLFRIGSGHRLVLAERIDR